VAEWNQLWSKLETVEFLLRDVKAELAGQAGGFSGAAEDEKSQLLVLGESQTREEYTTVPGIQAGARLPGEFIPIGDNSVAAMAIALGRGSNEQVIQDIVGNSVLPLFGLDNETRLSISGDCR
jgi:hypothetical protein